ncbi:MAG: hypothetical protein HQK49_07990 [Oligoflexia bacterium]|nr:hypothetical protein [Oligoflexia bacterium]
MQPKKSAKINAIYKYVEEARSLGLSANTYSIDANVLWKIGIPSTPPLLQSPLISAIQSSLFWAIFVCIFILPVYLYSNNSNNYLISILQLTGSLFLILIPLPLTYFKFKRYKEEYKLEIEKLTDNYAKNLAKI